MAAVEISEPTYTLLVCYDELLATHLADQTARQERLRQQGAVILALDGCKRMWDMKCSG